MESFICYNDNCKSIEMKTFTKYEEGMSNCPDLVLIIQCQICKRQHYFGTC